jgi:hypothetical protein
MTIQVRVFSIAVCVVTLLSISSFAQTPETRQTNSTPQSQQSSNTPLSVNSTDPVANEIGLLRKSLQTLNARLREISDKFAGPDSKQSDGPTTQQGRISASLDLLSKAELRAEGLRKQLLELTEKETAYKSRLVQFDEDLRPENIERAMTAVGTTRPAELRDARRRILENDRRGFESLLIQTAQSRIRLDEDVRQADSLVSRLRQRVLPLIDKEIDKLNPN